MKIFPFSFTLFSWCPDISSWYIILVCGSEKAQPELTDAIVELLNSQIRDEETSLCTNVIISDKYALTVAHCVEGLE